MKKFILLKLVFIIICFVNTILYAQQIKLTQDVPDSSAGNVPCYKIETDYAVYYLEKYGLGLSSMLDKDGNDWISFHNAKYSQAGGEYRGFPNAVHQQDGNFFHPKNRATGLSVSEIVYVGSDKITIKGTSGSNNWECVWDFYSTYCTFTMTKMWNRGKYWILYEGTPAGKYDDTDWWMTSQVKEKTALTITHEGDIPEPEWIAFGDKKFERVIFLLNHEDDNYPDRFYQMHRLMTVFGFGRKGIVKYLDKVPRRFSLGFVESSEHQIISNKIQEILNINPNY